MTQAHRHAKQTERMTEQARVWAEQREKLAPKTMAVYVASLFPFFPWRDVSFSRIALNAAHRAHAVTVPAPFAGKLVHFGNDTIEIRSPA